METKTCNGCGETKGRTLEFFRSDARNRDRLNGKCRVCDSAKAKAWYAANRERGIQNAKAWRERNPDRVAAHVAARREGRSARDGYRIDVLTDRERLVTRIRNRLNDALGARVQLGRCKRWLGCTPTELMAHLESQFAPGMTWENRGEWHVDHIRPLASFDLTDPEQRLAACHYTNLQPLWAADNQAKGARLDWAA